MTLPCWHFPATCLSSIAVCLAVAVDPHPVFRRQGRDLLCDVVVGLATAALGGTLEIPTLDGPATVNLPAGTRSGAPPPGRRSWIARYCAVSTTC